VTKNVIAENVIAENVIDLLIELVRDDVAR
jgi:hypothetical protein